jgi:hypothetical protein
MGYPTTVEGFADMIAGRLARKGAVRELLDDARQEAALAVLENQARPGRPCLADQPTYYYRAALVRAADLLATQAAPVRLTKYARYDRPRDVCAVPLFVERADEDEPRGVQLAGEARSDADVEAREAAERREAVVDVVRSYVDRFPARDCELLYRVFGVAGRRGEEVRQASQATGHTRQEAKRALAKVRAALRADPGALRAWRLYAEASS